MLWPMLDEVDEEEKEEVSDYLKSSSYELFDLIENLTLLLVDFELLGDEPEIIEVDELLYSLVSDIAGEALSDISAEKLNLRRQHFLRCIELCVDICQQITDTDSPLPISIESNFSSGTYSISISGPGIEDPDDKYSAELHYSLFNRARGNSKIAGFSLLRLRNLMNMIGGKFAVNTDEESTLLVLEFPAN